MQKSILFLFNIAHKQNDTNIVRSGLLVFAKGVCVLVMMISLPAGGQEYSVSLSKNLNQIDPPSLAKEYTFTQWSLIGPFVSNTKDIVVDPSRAIQKALQYDFLAREGHIEKRFTSEDLSLLCENGKLCRIHTQHGAVLNFDKIYPGKTSAVIYAATQIEAKSDGSVGLEYDYNNGVQVWLNGELLVQDNNATRHPVFKNFKFLPLHLQKGTNLLLIKVDQEPDGITADRPWALVASIIPFQHMFKLWLDREDGNLLKNRILNAGDALYLTILDHPVLHGTPSSVQLSIEDWRGNSVLSKRVQAGGLDGVELPHLEDGYYAVTLQVENNLLRDSFYFGNPEEVYKKLNQVQLASDASTQEHLQRDPIIQRYRILTSSKYAHPIDPEWQRKLLMVLGDGVRSLHSSKEQEWLKAPGMHLREFISKVDGTPQNYLLYLPQNSHGPMPLVIVMPYAVSHQLPFLESSLLTYFDYMIKLRHASDANEIAIAVINGRGTVGDAPIGEADAFEVLSDITGNYSIDRSRLYVYGNCEGGRRAILLAEHYPEIFAAVGVYGPLLMPYGRNPISQHGDPFFQVKQLSSTPVILTKGEFDDSSSTVTLNSFYQSLLGEGAKSEMEIVSDGMHDQDGSMEEQIFARFSQYRKAVVTTSIEEQIDKARNRVVH